MAEKYRKKPVVVEAMQWDGTGASLLDIEAWSRVPGIGNTVRLATRPDSPPELWVDANSAWLPIEPGEWIIRDAVQPLPDRPTRYYPCKAEVFAATYEAMKPAPQVTLSCPHVCETCRGKEAATVSEQVSADDFHQATEVARERAARIAELERAGHDLVALHSLGAPADEIAAAIDVLAAVLGPVRT